MEKTRITTTDIIRGIWLQTESKKPEDLWEALHDEEKYKAVSSSKLKERLEEFKKDYDAITIVQDVFFKVANRLKYITSGMHLPILYRWDYKEAPWFKIRLISDEMYSKSVFVLDDSFESYVFPEGVLSLGYCIDTNGQYVIMDGSGAIILRTESLDELIWLGVASCKYLLIGSKSSRGDAAVGKIRDVDKNQILSLFLEKEKEVRNVMAFPGARGCYANNCLKNYPGVVQFIDCWGDVLDKVNEKAIVSGSEDDGASDVSKKEEEEE